MSDQEPKYNNYLQNGDDQDDESLPRSLNMHVTNLFNWNFNERYIRFINVWNNDLTNFIMPNTYSWRSQGTRRWCIRQKQASTKSSTWHHSTRIDLSCTLALDQSCTSKLYKYLKTLVRWLIINAKSPDEHFLARWGSSAHAVQLMISFHIRRVYTSW